MTKDEKSLKRFKNENSERLATGGNHARGRPRLAAAMSDAERAKKYRDNKKLCVTPINRLTVIGHDVPHSATGTMPSYGMLESRIVLLNAENIRLSDDLQDARDQIAALRKALRDAEFVTRHEKSPAGKTKSPR